MGEIIRFFKVELRITVYKITGIWEKERDEIIFGLSKITTLKVGVENETILSSLAQMHFPRIHCTIILNCWDDYQHCPKYLELFSSSTNMAKVFSWQ